VTILYSDDGREVKKLLLEKSPNTVIQHCANHRLQLLVRDTVKEVAGINQFMSVIDTLNVLHHALPKNHNGAQKFG
jgi:hypothetical protein